MHAPPDEGVLPDRHRRRLLWLLVANVAASSLHYGDNVMFFHEYPEPPWINTRIIDGFWWLMTPLAVLGYLLLLRHRVHSGCALLYLYALASLLVLGHYLYAPLAHISLRIHAFILLEAVLAIALAGYVAVIQIGHASGSRMR